MHEKIYRFLFIETLFKSRFMILAGMMLLMIIEGVTLTTLDAKISESQVRKALADRTMEMEQILYPGTGRTILIDAQSAEPIKIDGKLYTLKGIRKLEDKLSALINEDVYQEGDMIGNYQITRITVNSVLFKSTVTNELRILRFGY